jgi:uncharacterized delta-60 repeat protein
MPARPLLACPRYIPCLFALVAMLGLVGCIEDSGSDNNGGPDTTVADAGDATDTDAKDDAWDTDDASDTPDVEGDASDTQDQDGGDIQDDVDTGCADDDSDGVCNANDICVGFDDASDADGDGVPDGCDGCPEDTNKDEIGLCGCGFADPASGTDCPNDPGDIDDTFAPGATNGVQVLTDPAFDEVRDARVLGDNSIIIAGWRENSPSGRDFLAAKLDADGAQDTAFGASGYAIVDFAGGEDRAHSIAVAANHGFALVGHATDAEQRAAVARFDAAGTLDTTFSQDGTWTDTNLAAATLTAGTFASNGELFVTGDYGTVQKSVLWGRLDATGAWDSTFQTNGYATYSGATGDVFVDAMVWDGAKYVLGGHLEDGAEDDLLTFGLDTAGNVTTWGNSGVSESDLSPGGPSAERIDALAVDSAGRVLAAGEYRIQGGEIDIVVARFDATGQPDTTFGTDGFTRIDFGGLDRAFAIAVQADDRILVGGRSTQAFSDSAVVARLDVSGALDTSFQTDGKLTLLPGTSAESEVRAIGLQDDKLIIVGNLDDSSDQDIFLMRLFQ